MTDGIDLSHWQGTVNWAQIKRDGIPFALAKVNEGDQTGGVDPRWSANRAGALAEGVPIGGYHFARPGTSDPEDAAILFGRHLGQAPGMLPPFLDYETAEGQTPQQLDNWLNRWLTTYRRPAGIYTAAAWWLDHLGIWPTKDQTLAARPLWLARYSSAVGLIPAPWTEVAIWQHTDRDTFPGIDGLVDGDVLVSETVPQLVAFADGLSYRPPPDHTIPEEIDVDLDAAVHRLNQLAGGGALDNVFRRFLAIQRDVYGGQSQTQNLAAIKSDLDQIAAAETSTQTTRPGAQHAEGGPDTPAVTVQPVEPTQGG